MWTSVEGTGYKACWKALTNDTAKSADRQSE